MSPEAPLSPDQQQLFDPTPDAPSVEEQVARMAEANRMPGHDSPSLDPELQARREDRLEDQAGFTVADAEKEAAQVDPRDIVTPGVKRALAMKRQRKEPKTGRAKVDEIARLSSRGKAARDRGMAPEHETHRVPRIRPGDLPSEKPESAAPQRPAAPDRRRLLAFELETDDPDFPPPVA